VNRSVSQVVVAMIAKSGQLQPVAAQIMFGHTRALTQASLQWGNRERGPSWKDVPFDYCGTENAASTQDDNAREVHKKTGRSRDRFLLATIH